MTKSEDLTRTGHDDQWHAAILGDVRGARILGMGPDVWEVGHRLASRVGSSGRYTGVYVDAETIRAARQRNGANGGARVEFHEIDGDLQLSRAAADAVVARQAPATLDDFVAVQHELERLRIDQPLVKNQSIDLVFSTGLRHLESHAARTRMLREFHRVIKRGGRLVVLDVVSDEDASDEVLRKAGPVDGDTIGSTVARDADLLGALADVGFYGVTLVRRDDTPWTIVDGIEFRRVAVVAYRGKEGPCFEHFQAVMYRGPFKSVQDDDGHVYPRGEQIAVCQKTFSLLARAPYRDLFEFSEPLISVAPGTADAFPCHLTNPIRNPRDLKFRLGALGAKSKDVSPDPPAASTPDRSSRPAPLSAGGQKRLTIVEQRATGASSGTAALATALGSRHGDTLEIRMVELATDPDPRLPAQLGLRLSLTGDACLPALVVDGVLVAVAPLPDLEEVEKLIATGRPSGPLPISNLAALAAEAGACGPAGCC